MIEDYQVVIKFDGKGYLIQLVHEPSECQIDYRKTQNSRLIGAIVLEMKNALTKELSQ